MILLIHNTPHLIRLLSSYILFQVTELSLCLKDDSEEIHQWILIEQLVVSWGLLGSLGEVILPDFFISGWQNGITKDIDWNVLLIIQLLPDQTTLFIGTIYSVSTNLMSSTTSRSCEIVIQWDELYLNYLSVGSNNRHRERDSPTC